jgi:hypothetical protein
MSVPNSLKLINAAEVSNVVVSRENTTIYPTGGQDYDSGDAGLNVIEFKIPVASNKSVDMSTFFMHFNVQITNKPANTFAYFQDSIESIIDEVVVYIGNSGQEIERIRGYNRLESAMNYYISDNYTKSVGSALFSCGLSRDERLNLFSNGTNASGNVVSQSVPLRLCGCANPNFIMPSQIFGQSNFLIVRVRLAPPVQCIMAYTLQNAVSITTGGSSDQGNLSGGEYVASSARYSLTNVRASFDMIQTSQDYQNQMASFLASSSLVYPVKTWDVDFRSIPSNRASFVENLSYNYRDVESIFFWFNLQSELESFAFAGQDRLHVPRNTATGANAIGTEVLQSLQLTINGQKIPSVPIELRFGATEALCHTLVALGALHISEEVGPFSWEKILSLGYGTGTGVTAGTVNQPETTIAYSNLSGNRYYGRNFNGKTNFRQLVGANNVVADTGVLNPYLQDQTPSYLLIGLNMRKLLDLPEGELSGLNLQNTSGSIGYELRFTESSANVPAYSMGVAVCHNRFIELSGSGVSVNI